MAEEPSAKRHRVELHRKETLEIVCTSEPDKADKVISMLWRKACGQHHRIVGVGVHYTTEDEPPQMAAVLQLCLDELCLVYHIAAATK
ncbi:unnamed protein product [Triticum turgidum subsp. durum]|uniref:Uncharacterized protein n=1 Tax=Triticum turgidum subsp. durum TaxID=4567 RepID=A0A9R0ZAU4_TRITD|nr:unnamed protein product [Triticum turgidum subsp. durum]